MLDRPVVSILAVDPEDSLRYIEVRGAVAEVTEEGVVDHMHSLSRMYTNKNYYGEFVPAERADQETRVIFKIKPTKVITHGH